MTMPKDKRPRRRIMRSLKINEISAVDYPAQTGAKALIMKRDVEKVLPKPRTGEKEDVFVARFMSNGDAKEEFTDNKQRLGVAFSRFRESRKAAADEAFKRGRAVLTSSESDHTHLIMLEDFEGMPISSGMTTFVNDHTHPWIMEDDGTIVIGEADGHTHSPERMSKGSCDEVEVADLLKDLATKAAEHFGKDRDPKEQDMPEDAKKAAEDLKAAQDKIAELEKKGREEEAKKFQLETDLALSQMNSEERDYYKGLDAEAKKDFIALSQVERSKKVKVELAKQAEVNPVVYTAEDGTEYRKNDDPRLVTLAKQADDDRKALVAEQNKGREADLRKRAETELAHLPGSIETRVELLKAAEAIEDETARGEAVAALKAHNAKMAPAFKTVGTTSQPNLEAGNDKQAAEKELEKLAKARASEKDEDYYTAYTKVGEQHPELLAKAVG